MYYRCCVMMYMYVYNFGEVELFGRRKHVASHLMHISFSLTHCVPLFFFTNKMMEIQTL